MKASWYWLSEMVGKVGTVARDLWPINILLASVAQSWNNGDGILILALLYMVCIDTITKVAAICCQKISAETGIPPEKVSMSDIVCGFIKAICKDYITSRALGAGFARKMFLYLPLILLALLINDNKPRIVGGINVIQVLADGIYSVLIVTEIVSMLENFKDMGSKKLERLEGFICSISERAGFGKISMSMKIENENPDLLNFMKKDKKEDKKDG